MPIIGVCGDNCSCCPRYIATQDGKLEALERVKGLWVRLGFRETTFPPEDLTCNGCEADNHCAYPELRACAYKRGFENCGLCEEYPCHLINAAFEETEQVKFKAMNKCTSKDMDTLNEAFFLKKQILDQIHAKKNITRD